MTACELMGGTCPVDPGGLGRHRWNMMKAAMLPLQLSSPRKIAV
jgi:hypothetical protein